MTLDMPFYKIGKILTFPVISKSFSWYENFHATNLLLVTFLIPVSASLLGALFLHEKLRLEHFAGMAMPGLALAVIDGRIIRLVVGAARLLGRKTVSRSNKHSVLESSSMLPQIALPQSIGSPSGF